MKFSYLLPAVLLSCTPVLLQAQQASKIQLAFEHKVKTETLELGRSYTNDFREVFTPLTFKYYVSDIGFVDDSGRFVQAATSAYLVDEAEPESKRIAFTIPPGRYTQLRFVIGIDSLRSVSGVHEGALDPYRGMFWTWNTGFVSAKLEGNAAVSGMPQQLFQYHIGGFRTGQNSLRTIQIPLDTVLFEHDQKTLVTISADILKWFNGKHALRIAGNNFVHTPGELANRYADNYTLMFHLDNYRRY